MSPINVGAIAEGSFVVKESTGEYRRLTGTVYSLPFHIYECEWVTQITYIEQNVVAMLHPAAEP